tara:strand:- start:118 stop:555 length:438 start_codon:yes stop_codon:yes gene_type:complete
MMIYLKDFMLILRKKYKFCAAHQYKNSYWDEKKNIEVFGDDYRVHGHNYVVIVAVTGELNKDTGFIVDLQKVNTIMKKDIISELDHSNIQEDISWFKDKQPSSENLAIYIFDKLKEKIELPTKLHSVKIEETPTISSEYFGATND